MFPASIKENTLLCLVVGTGVVAVVTIKGESTLFRVYSRVQ